MKKHFITVILLFLALVNVSSQDQDFLDFVEHWNQASYYDEARFSDILIGIQADYEYDGQNFTYVASISSEKKEYYLDESGFDKEFIEGFPDIPVPRCFFEENHPIRGVPYYFIDEMLGKYYPLVEKDSDSYTAIVNQFLDYCGDYEYPFLIIASINQQSYIYFEPLDEFIRIFAP